MLQAALKRRFYLDKALEKSNPIRNYSYLRS